MWYLQKSVPEVFLYLAAYLIYITVSSQTQPVNIRRLFGFIPKIWYFLLTIFYRTQAFHINLVYFSCLKGGFPWLPRLDLLLTIFLLMELVSRPTIRSEKKVFRNIFTPSSLHNGPLWFPSYTVPRAGVLRSTSVSTSWEKSAKQLWKHSYFAFRQLTTEENRRIL